MLVIIQRFGVSRFRHVVCHYLFVQRFRADIVFESEKVFGSDNSVDMGTTNPPWENMFRTAFLGMGVRRCIVMFHDSVFAPDAPKGGA